ncbi:unnamed protein product, partial [Plutella xylostella]
MGISNSIGSNTFDILLCLGLPWLIKSLFYPATPDHHWVTINSSGISYSAISLLSTLFALYGCLALNKFSLDWRVGVTCAVIYLGFVILAALLELNVFFVVNLPCAQLFLLERKSVKTKTIRTQSTYAIRDGITRLMRTRRHLPALLIIHLLATVSEPISAG